MVEYQGRLSWWIPQEDVKCCGGYLGQMCSMVDIAWENVQYGGYFGQKSMDVYNGM